MILTCPECATAFFVDEAKIPPAGRTVKCGQCQHRWTAHAEAPIPIVEDEPEPEDDRWLEERERAAAEAAEAQDDSADEAEETISAEDLPKAFRAKAADEKKVREAAATGVIWAAMAAALVLMIAIAAVFRVNVVTLWPKSAAAYAAVGLPVNSLGLTLEAVRAEPALQEGHAALSVSGMFRNVKDVPITAPPLRISLLNKAGKRLSTKIAQPADAVVPPGETRHFAIAILDPPASAAQLEVAFAPEAAKKGVLLPKAARAPTSHAPEAPVLREPDPAAVAPVEAKPLPSSSPYALEPHG